MWRNWLLPLGLLITALLLFVPAMSGGGTKTFDYSDLLTRVNAGTVASVTINDKGAVDGKLKDGTEFTSQIPTALDTTTLSTQLQAKGVAVKGTQTGGSWISVLLSFLPLLLLVGFFVWTGGGRRGGSCPAAARSARSAGRRRRSPIRSGRRPGSPTSPAMRVPSRRSARSSTSCATQTVTAGLAPRARGAC